MSSESEEASFTSSSASLSELPSVSSSSVLSSPDGRVANQSPVKFPTNTTTVKFPTESKEPCNFLTPIEKKEVKHKLKTILFLFKLSSFLSTLFIHSYKITIRCMQCINTFKLEWRKKGQKIKKKKKRIKLKNIMKVYIK